MVSGPLTRLAALHLPNDLERLTGLPIRYDIDIGVPVNGSSIFVAQIRDARWDGHRKGKPDEVRIKVDVDDLFGAHIRYIAYIIQEGRWRLVINGTNDAEKLALPGELHIIRRRFPEPEVPFERTFSLLHAAGLSERLCGMRGTPFRFSRTVAGGGEVYTGTVKSMEASETSIRLKVDLPPILGTIPVTSLRFDRFEKWTMELPDREPFNLQGTLELGHSKR